jgi:hypothetical protein
MPPMERQVPDPLKQLRQKQAAEAKVLAAQQTQRSGAFKEQAKNREAEAIEKAANAERLKISPTADPSGNASNNREQLPNPATEPPQETGDTVPKGPTETPLEDPKFIEMQVKP